MSISHDYIDQFVEKKIMISGSKEDRVILEINRNMKSLELLIKNGCIIIYEK